MGKSEHELKSNIRPDKNKRLTRKRFDSFYTWSRRAIKNEFNTALWEHINISEVTSIFDLLDELRNEKLNVLDAGCGSGRFLLDLKKRYGNVTGGDFSIGLLKKAKKVGIGDVPLVQADVDKLPFKDESFDIVLSVRVIQHLRVNEQQNAINEMSRVLKKGGRLIIMTYNALTLLSLYKQINMSGLNKMWPWWPLRDWKWAVDDYSFPWEIKKMLKNASLVEIKLKGAVCGEPEVLKFLKISHFLERHCNFIFKKWLDMCKNIDFCINSLWPFKFFLGRILAEGKKE